MARAPLGFVRRRAIGIVAVALYLILWGLALALLGLLWWPFAVPAFVPLIVVHRLSDDGRMLDPYRWIKGWRGESNVKKILKHLEPQGYRVVHHLDIGWGDVDHVVVGPTGIYAIDTKNHIGRFSQRGASLLKNGRPVDEILTQVRGEAAAVRERTAMWTQAVVVVPPGGLADRRLYFQKATVVDNDGLIEFITDQRRRLDSYEVDRIAGLLTAD